MIPRRRLPGFGVAALAALAVTVVGAPAASGHETQATDAGGAQVAAQRQVGMHVGSPVELGAAVRTPGWLLLGLPEGEIAVEGFGGQDLLRLDATRVYAKTEAPGLGQDLGGVVGPIADQSAPATVREHQHRERGAGSPGRADAPARLVDRAGSPAVTGEVEIPARAGGDGAWAFGWVPIQTTGPAGAVSGGLPAAGLGALALGAGAAAVVVARRRSVGPG